MSTQTKGRMCDGKRRNATEAAARGQLASLVRNRGADPARYRIYACPYCKGWHVGHTPRGKR